MSGVDKPKGNPVNPPIPNMGKKAKAKSIGVLKRIEPPQSVIKRHDRITTEGIEISIVVV